MVYIQKIKIKKTFYGIDKKKKKLWYRYIK